MTPKTLGDPNKRKILEEIIRVDHAGEYGAKKIYSGQLAALKKKKDLKAIKIIQHMKDQEDVHFDYFDKEIIKNKIRPTLMQPIWNIAGFALGFGTALMGKKAAMACTVAVEEVIDEHYQEQLQKLDGEDKLKESIEKFRQEELDHRDIGLENEAEDLKYYQPLTFLIKNASKMAIAISKRI